MKTTQWTVMVACTFAMNLALAGQVQQPPVEGRSQRLQGLVSAGLEIGQPSRVEITGGAAQAIFETMDQVKVKAETFDFEVFACTNETRDNGVLFCNKRTCSGDVPSEFEVVGTAYRCAFYVDGKGRVKAATPIPAN